MRRGVPAALVLLALLLFAGCAPAPPPGSRPAAGLPGYGGRFVYPLRGEPHGLNFVSDGDVLSSQVETLVGDSLVDLDVHLKVVPRLASSWETSTDGRTLTFHLRPGVRFHDGVPLTSADVLYTYERLIDPKSRAIGRLDGFLPIEKVLAPDPLTVKVLYRSAYAPALIAWDVPILPRHLYEKEEFLSSPHNRAPIGSGPFLFSSWEPGQRIVLRANPDYWGGRPRLDTIVFQIIPSQETTLQALLAGEIDWSTLTPMQGQAQATGAAFERRFRILRCEALWFYYIAFRGDGSNPFFADPVVRRAVSLALDRAGYVRSILHGLGRPASSPFHPAVGGGDPDLPALPYDPGTAASLLDAAGWRIDRASGLRARGGTPFRFTLLVFGGEPAQTQFSQVAQESLRRLGIEMAIEKLDWPTLWSRLQKGEYQAAFSGISPGADPDALFSMFHSSQIKGGQNYAAFRDASIDAWFEAARRTLEERERRALYQRIDRRLAELQPYAFLFIPTLQGALSRRIGNAEISPRGLLSFYPGGAALYAEDGDGS
ncbi:MAG TPA: ABC transporter substrate-binding protein [Candidatus Polarisedimenticolia bacterium]|nr:ABC transporter substrate-binding protein [Candidatus Polarisedimenticolia bacterium]